METYDELVITNVFETVGIAIERRPEFRSEMERNLAAKWGNGGGKWSIGQCKICGTDLGDPRTALNFAGESLIFTAGCCDGCVPVRDAHYDTQTRTTGQTVSRHPQWDENCPILYKELIDQPPERINRQTLRQVAEWKPDAKGRGLIVSGESGAGKTTALWALFKQLEAAEYSPLILTAVELQRQLSEAARDIKDVKHLTHCRVLIVDDLGKERLTAAVGALLWEVIDSRYCHRRPVVISTRYAGEAFEARFGDGILGKDIRRRLIDCCEVVKF